MDDNTAKDADLQAKTIATIWRLSQLLNVPVEDAAAIYIKVGTAFGKAEATRKSAS